MSVKEKCIQQKCHHPLQGNQLQREAWCQPLSVCSKMITCPYGCNMPTPEKTFPKAGFRFVVPPANLQSQKKKNNIHKTSRVHHKIRSSREFPRVIVLSFVSHNQHRGVFQAALHMFPGRTTSHTATFIITPERKEEIQ